MRKGGGGGAQKRLRVEGGVCVWQRRTDHNALQLDRVE